jgi:peroxiredoxin
MVMKCASFLWLLLLVCPAAFGGGHAMHGPGGDPLAVPVWDEYFAEGPFEVPAEPLPGGEACVREGWRQIFRLDEVRAVQWFRAALEKDGDSVSALVGLAVANHARPGRAAAAVRRVFAQNRPGEDSPIMEIAGVWRDSLAGLPAARISDGASRAALLAGAGQKPFTAAGAGRERVAGLRRMGVGRPLVRMLLARELLLAAADPVGASDHDLRKEALVAMAEGSVEYPDHRLDCLVVPESSPGLSRGVPDSAGAGLAWARRLERAGWLAESAAWFGWARDRADELLMRMPGDILVMDWFHESAEGQARALASAGERKAALAAAREAGESCLRETALRLGAWEAIRAAAPRALRGWPEPSVERAAWLHAQTLAALRAGELSEAFAGLASLREVVAQVSQLPGRSDGNLAGLVAELEWWLQKRTAEQTVPGGVPADERGIPAVRMLPMLAAAGQIDRAKGLLRGAFPMGLPERDAAQAAGLPFPVSDELVRRWGRASVDSAVLPGVGSGAGNRSDRMAPALPGERGGGRLKVMLFFLGYRCDHCLKQLDAFVPWRERFEIAGADLLAVSVDAPERVAETWAGPDRSLRRAYPFPILPDPSLELFRGFRAWDEYGAGPIHATVVVDRSGRIRWQHRGTEPFPDAAAVLRVVEAAADLP